MNIRELIEQACKEYADNHQQQYDFRQGAIFVLKVLLEVELNEGHKDFMLE